jgi:hypothetical protein
MPHLVAADRVAIAPPLSDRPPPPRALHCRFILCKRSSWRPTPIGFLGIAISQHHSTLSQHRASATSSLRQSHQSAIHGRAPFLPGWSTASRCRPPQRAAPKWSRHRPPLCQRKPHRRPAPPATKLPCLGHHEHPTVAAHLFDVIDGALGPSLAHRRWVPATRPPSPSRAISCELLSSSSPQIDAPPCMHAPQHLPLPAATSGTPDSTGATAPPWGASSPTSPVGCRPMDTMAMGWAWPDLAQSAQCTLSFIQWINWLKFQLVQTRLNSVEIQFNLEFDQINSEVWIQITSTG